MALLRLPASPACSTYRADDVRTASKFLATMMMVDKSLVASSAQETQDIDQCDRRRDAGACGGGGHWRGEHGGLQLPGCGRA